MGNLMRITQVCSALKMSGGLPRITLRFLKIWREEGWKGFLRVARLINDAKRFDRLSLKVEPIGALERHPLISILFVADSWDAKQSVAAIASVRNQNYPHWELWIACKAQAAPKAEVWHASTVEDSRIRLAFRQVGEPHPFSHQLLHKLKGEYVVILDGRGKLNEHALYWIVRELVAHPDAGFIYADEDKLDSAERHVAPHFKPDWNPDLFLACDYVGSLKVLRTHLARELGGFRTGCSESQGYDLAVRAVERLEARDIRHIPRILYHEYLDTNAGDRDKDAISQKAKAAASIVRNHLARRDIHAMISESEEMPGCLRVRYVLPTPPPEVTLLIPTRNGLEILRRCMNNIETRTDYPCYDIIIIDNGSDDPATLNYLMSLHGKQGLQVIRDGGPFNFSRLNNLAVTRAKGTVVGLLNNDLEVINADWLIEMVSQALRPEIGIVGARLWYPDDTLQHAGVVMAGGVARHVHKGLARGENGYFGRAVLPQNFVAVTAACLVMRKKIYEEVGGLDEEFAVAFNDIDFCMRVAARGYRNLWTPYAELYHHESVSRGHEDTPEKRVRFMNEIERMKVRWGSAMFNDPAYNPNLHDGPDDFSRARITRRAG